MASEIFKCDICDKSYDTRGKFKKDNFSRHQRKFHMSAGQARGENSPPGVNDEDATKSQPSPRVIDLCDVEDGFNRSIIMQAASSGNIAMLEAFINSGIELNTEAYEGSTALHYAARAGQTAAVQFLLGQGANVKTTNRHGRMPFYEAILSRNPDTVSLLLRVTEKEELDRNLPHWIARSGSFEAMQVCAEHLGTAFMTMYHQDIFTAAAGRGHTSMIAALVRCPDFDINGRNEAGSAPIHQAVRHGRFEVLETLLACEGIDLNIETRVRSLTPLHIATYKGHLEIVKILLNQTTVKVNSVTKEHETPLHLAIIKKHTEVVKHLIHHDDVDINAKGLGEQTPLHLAASIGHVRVVEYIINHDGLDINPKNSNEQTPLHLAASRGHLKAVEYLISHNGVDINPKNLCEQTPLHLAASSGHSEVVKLLLGQSLVEPRYQDKKGDSPLHLSAFGGHWETVHVLLEHLGDSNRFMSPIPPPLEKEFDRAEVTRKLLAHNDFQDVNRVQRGWPGYSLLHRATKKADCDVMQVLLAHPDINVNIESLIGQSPLMIAAEKDHLDAARLLLEHKDININFRVLRNRSFNYYRGWTALKFAGEYNYQDFVDLLLLHGAKDNEPNSALTPRGESNVADAPGVVEMQNNLISEQDLEPQTLSFLDQYIDDGSMDGLDMSHAIDTDMTA
ncbi:Nn.00g028160.m01.CDS01 [Neocucurbitaria sp. VM-36]